jgi:hypothetical protein
MVAKVILFCIGQNVFKLENDRAVLKKVSTLKLKNAWKKPESLYLHIDDFFDETFAPN